MGYRIIQAGVSRSFPSSHPFLTEATESGSSLVFLGQDAGGAFAAYGALEDRPFVAVELGQECLGIHTGERRGEEGSNVLGFARYRMGTAAPTELIELVMQPRTSATAIDAARTAFETVGLKVALCHDFPGRIVDRLVRPYFNSALRRLDEGLASADDLDATLRLGLGYPEGPIALLERTGLVEHHDATLFLHQQFGGEAYAPARRAKVAKLRASDKR